MSVATDHPLTRLLHDAAHRSFPASDGSVEVFGPPPGPCDVALAFTGHAVVAADVSEDWVHQHVPEGWAAGQDHHGTLSVHFLGALSDHLGSAPAGLNLLLAAPKPPQAGPRAELRTSNRIRSDWAAYRSEVSAYENTDGTGVINLGRGPGGRWDLWIELQDADRPWVKASTVVRGRELLEAARVRAPDDLFASVPAYDARALRTFLAGGFRAIGAEVLFLTRPGQGNLGTSS